MTRFSFRFSAFPRLMACAFLGLGLGDGSAQDSAQTDQAGRGVFHSFTDKQGRKMEARVVSLSSDRKIMTIAQRDGKEFELEIVKLSLDDQQFLKGWLATQPLHANVRLEVSVEKVSGESDARRRYLDYKLLTDHPAYRISITNLSRQTLTKPRIEYFLLKDEAIRIYQSGEEWTFSSRSSDLEREPERTGGMIELEDLVYNREQVVTTAALNVDRVLGDGNDVHGEDTVLGVILQVRDDFDNVIGTFRSAESSIKNVSWEEVAKDAPTNENGSGTASKPAGSSASVVGETTAPLSR